MLFKRWKPGNADQGVRPELGEANPSWDWNQLYACIYQRRRPTGHQLKPVRAFPNPPSMSETCWKVLV